MARCIDCEASLPSPDLRDAPTLFEIDFARALCTKESPDTPEGRALAELVDRFDIIAQYLLAAQTTNDELETEVKIARSNLALAEANTEALEETMRRRAPMMPGTAFPGGAPLTTGGSRFISPEMGQHLWGEPLLSSPIAASPADESGKTAMSFWRRKRGTPSPTPVPPIISTLADNRLSTPNLADLPPLPSSPSDSGKRDSLDPARLSVTSNGIEDERALLFRRLEQLSMLLAHERTATSQLRIAHSGLVAERDALNVAHAELQGELETLSQALFEEANRMVADERQRVSQLEDEVYDLRAQLEDLRQAAERSLEEELGLEAPATARPTLPPSPVVTATSSAASSQPLSLLASPHLPLTITSPPIGSTAARALASPSPSLRTPNSASMSPTSSTLDSPREEAAAAGPGRQWLKSFGRKTGPKPSAVEDALTSIAADAALLAAPSPIEVHPPRDSLPLDDDDLLPTSITPSPEPPTPEPQAPPQPEYNLPDGSDPAHIRDASLDSLSTILTDSSFHSPGIETAFETQSPLTEPRKRRTGSSGRHRSPGRSPSFKASARATADSFAFTRSPPRGRRSPPVSPRIPSPLPPSPQLPAHATFSPPISPPMPSSPPPVRTSSRGAPDRRPHHRPPPLALDQTPPMPQFDDDGDMPVRVPTPKSARRAGLILGLDASAVFPHREGGQGLPSALLGSGGSSSTPTTPSMSAAAGNWAKQRGGGGVGLMRNVHLPSTPVSGSTIDGDLDRLLDNLANMGAELDA